MARREKGTDKWRADIQVNGKRKTKLCATEEEAKKLEAHYQHQLIDGKPGGTRCKNVGYFQTIEESDLCIFFNE